MKRNKFIGIFDSGFGGLSIMKEIVKKNTRYDFIYLGDAARVPYGNRSVQDIYKFSKEAVEYLRGKNCSLIILACNTASSEALRRLQKEYAARIKIIGVLVPAAEETAKVTENKRVAVVATQSTVRSKAFIREIKKINPQAKVFQKACPLLVPIVEAGRHNSEIANIILKKYLKPLLAKKIDTLVLGCTHYDILEKKIKKITGSRIKIVSEPKIVAKKLALYLKKHPEIEKQLQRKSSRRFYSTGPAENFQKLGSRFFGREIKTNKIKL